MCRESEKDIWEEMVGAFQTMARSQGGSEVA
ncbi:Os02g0691800 [Oryza sativa Japonica Group]|uniref:Os02g0691800 protein n=1 Tax=Oryza sativa subsp. japonica TaxID=39947 RepID=A0A0P0VN77_ORYSJ|nr:Os02g0691800 [Oryza sativa Japonica Group]